MGGAKPDQFTDVLQDDFLGHHEKLSMVQGRNRAVPAEVPAAPAGLDGAGEAMDAVFHQLGIMPQRQQGLPAKRRKGEAGEVRRSGVEGGPSRFQGLGKLDQGFFKFPPDDRIDAMAQEEIGIHPGIEPVKAEVDLWMEPPNLLDHSDGDSQRGVHWNRDPDQAGAGDRYGVQVFHAEVKRTRVETGLMQKTERGGQGDRLVAELVARDKEDFAWIFHDALRKLGVEVKEFLPLSIKILHRAIALADFFKLLHQVRQHFPGDRGEHVGVLRVGKGAHSGAAK